MVSFIQLGPSQIFKANGIVRGFLKIVLFIFLRKYLYYSISTFECQVKVITILALIMMPTLTLLKNFKDLIFTAMLNPVLYCIFYHNSHSLVKYIHC